MDRGREVAIGREGWHLVTCAGCGKRWSDALCTDCRKHLPALTLVAYLNHRVTLRQAVDCLRERRASCREFGGGRKR